MIYFTTWKDLPQSTPSLLIDCPKLGHDAGLLFIGHLAFGNMSEGAPFCVSPLDLETWKNLMHIDRGLSNLGSITFS